MFSFVRMISGDPEIPVGVANAEHGYAVGYNGQFIGYVADTGYAGTWKWQAYTRLGSVIAETTTRRDAAHSLVRMSPIVNATQSVLERYAPAIKALD